MKYKKLTITLLCCTIWLIAFSQIELDTLVYKPGKAKVSIAYENMRNSPLVSLNINHKDGATFYNAKSGQIKKFNVEVQPISIISKKITANKVEGFYMSKKRGLRGIIDTNGHTIIPPVFKEIKVSDSYDHYLAIGNEDSLYVINLNKEIVPLGNQYRIHASFITNDNRIKTETETEDVILDFQGNELMRSATYHLTTAGSTNYVFARPRDDFFGKQVLIDFEENIILQPKRKFEEVYADDKVLLFFDETKYSEAYDYDLNPITFPDFKIASPGWSSSFYEIRGAKGMGLLNRNMEVVIPPAQKMALALDKDVFLVENKEGKAHYNSKGERISPKGYQDIIRTKDSKYFIVRYGDWGVVNADNEVIIPIQQKRVRNYMRPIQHTSNTKHTFFAVKQSAEVSNLYNEKGALISEGTFTRMLDFCSSDGNRLFLLKGKRDMLLFNNEGQQVTPKTFRTIDPRLDGAPSEYLVVGNEDLQYGLIDKDGKELLPMIYKTIYNINDSILILQDEKGTGYFKIKVP